jgi:hypothetical protein
MTTVDPDWRPADEVVRLRSPIITSPVESFSIHAGFVSDATGGGATLILDGGDDCTDYASLVLHDMAEPSRRISLPQVPYLELNMI